MKSLYRVPYKVNKFLKWKWKQNCCYFYKWIIFLIWQIGFFCVFFSSLSCIICTLTWRITNLQKKEKYSYNEIIKEKKENKEEMESNTCISALFDNNIVYVNAHTMNINGEDNIRRVRNVKCEIYLEGCMHAR